MTRRLLPRYSTFSTVDDYFREDEITAAGLAALTVRTVLVAAANDAVFPVRRLYGLAGSPNLELCIHCTGGHMGFVDLFPSRHWLPGEVLTLIRDR